MNKNVLFWIFYFVSVVFVLSGAVNNGFSLYFMAIPFMLYMLWVSKFKFQKNILLYVSIFFIIFSIIISHTQTKNPVLYPILSDGYVEILEDGYHDEYSDGSGGFLSYEEKDRDGCVGCGEIEYLKLKKGEKYKVIGVEISHPEFGTEVNLITKIGQFGEYDYGSSKSLSNKSIYINKPVQSNWAKYLGILMAWPAIPMSMLSSI